MEIFVFEFQFLCVLVEFVDQFLIRCQLFLGLVVLIVIDCVCGFRFQRCCVNCLFENDVIVFGFMCLQFIICMFFKGDGEVFQMSLELDRYFIYSFVVK